MRWRDGIIIFLSFALFPFPFPFPCRLFSISLDLSGRCALSNKLYVVKADIGRLLVRIDYNQKKNIYVLYFFAKSGIQAQILGVLFFCFFFLSQCIALGGGVATKMQPAASVCVCFKLSLLACHPRSAGSHMYIVFFSKSYYDTCCAT